MADLYVTTPLYYVNAEPHLGHTYTTVIADTYARLHRDRGDRVRLLTGTDEHGEKITEAAAAAGVSPAQHADRVSALFRSTWDTCGIGYDHFLRTTDDYHVRTVREILARIHAAGDIYFAAYAGLYCRGCERFLTEKELVDGNCPDHRTPPRRVEEENYFFRMSRYQQRLIEHLESHPDTIQPDGYRNEVLSLLRAEALGDLCISRPKSRLQWGIDLPFDDRYVAYVWFDALINYVSGLRHMDPEGFDMLWPTATHFIGKDILKPHGIFWPTMLMAAGLPLYRRLNVHGYWTRGESKMSKSLGNVIRPIEMKERFGMDAFRYYLLREMAFGQDATFNEDSFITRINADLANNLGNLVSRALSMQKRYFDHAVQALGEPTADDRALAESFAAAAAECEQHALQVVFHRALEALWRAIDHANKYVVTTAPFTLAKDPAQRPRVGAILRNLLEGLVVVGDRVRPFLPETSARIFRMLGLPANTRWAAARWGESFPAGHRTGDPEILFPRVDWPKPADP